MTTEFVQSIVAAFKKNRIRAQQEEWGIVCTGGVFAQEDLYVCGLGSLLIGKPCTVTVDGKAMHLEGDFEKAASVHLNLHIDYVDGYVNGFDHGEMEDMQRIREVKSSGRHDVAQINQIQWNLGYVDGVMTWNALRLEGMAYERGDEDDEEEEEEREKTESDYSPVGTGEYEDDIDF